jgi:hypothetical protein
MGRRPFGACMVISICFQPIEAGIRRMDLLFPGHLTPETDWPVCFVYACLLEIEVSPSTQWLRH